jgi:hypothetical protein
VSELLPQRIHRSLSTTDLSPDAKDSSPITVKVDIAQAATANESQDGEHELTLACWGPRDHGGSDIVMCARDQIVRDAMK